MGLVETIRAAHACPDTMAKAQEALTMVQQWCATPRMPGADTITRLAYRIHLGMTVQEAAAREYCYRWHLPLNQWVNHAQARSKARRITGAWPVPHLIGM